MRAQIQRQRNRRAFVGSHDRQHTLHTVRFKADRIDHWSLFNSLDSYFQCLWIGCIDTDRCVNRRLNIFDEPNQILRLTLGSRARIRVEPIGARRRLFTG